MPHPRVVLARPKRLRPGIYARRIGADGIRRAAKGVRVSIASGDQYLAKVAVVR